MVPSRNSLVTPVFAMPQTSTIRAPAGRVAAVETKRRRKNDPLKPISREQSEPQA